MRDYSRAEQILRDYGLPDAGVRARVLPSFDDHNPVHLLRALRYCELAGLIALVAAAIAGGGVGPAGVARRYRDLVRFHMVGYGIAQGLTSWTDKECYAWTATQLNPPGWRGGASSVRNSYLRINKARGIVRLPQIVIVEAHPHWD